MTSSFHSAASWLTRRSRSRSGCSSSSMRSPATAAGELVRLQTRRHVVALTFDGCGNAEGAKSVLATLRRERVPVKFFLTGHFVRAYPAIARAIGRRYVVANHTVDHPHLTAMSNEAVMRQIVRANVLIRRATG